MKKCRKAAVAFICCILAVLTAFLCGCDSLVIRITEDARTTAYSETTESVPGTSQDTEPPVSPPGITPDMLTYDNSDSKAAVKALRDIDLNNSSFIIAISDGVSDTLIAENTDIATFYAERNEMAAEKYGCKIFSRTVKSAELKKDLSASVKSGKDMNSYFSDILLVDAKTGGELGVSGLLLDLRKLPYYEYDTVGNKGAGMYNTFNRFCISEATQDVLGTALIYFNRNLTGNDGASEIYSSVRNEQFTFEFFLNFISKYSSAAAYDISVSADKDISFMADIAALRLEYDFVSDADGKYPQLNEYSTEITDKLTSQIKALANCRYYSRFADSDPDGSLIFSAGQSLFNVGIAADMKALSTSATSWGVAPLPSAESSSENGTYGLSTGGKPVICAPSNNSRFELTGAMLSALNAASGSWITTAYINLCTKNYLRDNDSYFSLQSAMYNEQYYDYSDIYGTSVKGLYDSSIGAMRKCFTDGTSIADIINANRSAVNKALKSVK